MDFFQSPLYRANKRILFYLGQWPLQEPRERMFYRSITVLLVGSILLPKLIKFAECFGELNDMVKCLPVLGLHGATTVKFITFTFNAKKLRKLTYRIKDDWAARSAEDDDTILKHYAERGRFITATYSAYLFTTLWLYLLLPVVPILLNVIIPLNESRELIYLYQTEYFVDEEKYYFLILLHAYITMPVSVGVIIGLDTIFAVYVHHVCGIFSTVGSHLETIGQDYQSANSKIREDSNDSRDEAYDRIVKCIKMHKSAIEFSNLLESSTSVCFLFIIGICMFMITMTGFMTVTNLNEPGESLRFGAFTLGEIIPLFFVCWQGQMLIEHSEQIFVDAYNVKWYDISTRAQKLLILIMMRSAVPCRITAGRVYVLSLENFSLALKTSMSYFTVLLSLQ